ncbi:hypothetical protein Asulf_01012 [Archaeoglobus sulfaticallidus PM70-1]|uniref:Kinase binding protein CGI-121 n=2 Tax=Archaeoglobus TaxID=2233 RepID=N0BKJ9_9EURY|nr:hypothetical protein Asulf_01012 [Archaeoglobus sulfaticallidus PM70-1]
MVAYKIFCGVVGCEVEDFFNFFKERGLDVSAINAKYVLNREILDFAVGKALKRWYSGERISRNLGVEIMLYLFATRQIRDVIQFGLKERGMKVYVVVISDRDINEAEFDCVDIVDCEEMETELNEEKLKKFMEIYDINEEELEIAGKENFDLLVKEKIVLFDLNK